MSLPGDRDDRASEVNRQLLLTRRPVGLVEDDDFEMVVSPLPGAAGG